MGIEYSLTQQFLIVKDISANLQIYRIEKRHWILFSLKQRGLRSFQRCQETFEKAVCKVNRGVPFNVLHR
jgi:hypothetical protein